MGLSEELEEKGWYLSPEGIEICSDGNTNPKANDIIKQALDLDLKEIGRGILPEDINRGKITEISGNVVLMITRIRNIAVPKVQEENAGGPRMLKITMTDGVTTCHGVEFTKIDSINITKSAPGLKVRLKGKTLSVMGGLIKLTPENFELLGGKVDALIEKWKLQKELFYLQRTSVGAVAGDGPPKWVPFGQKLAKGKEGGGKEKPTENGSVPALGGMKEKSVEEEDNSEFVAQRNNAIEEASKVERKKFGGGNKPLTDSRAKKEKERERREEERAARSKEGEYGPPTGGERERPERGGRKGRRRDEEREDKSAPPPKGFSLRDFLGDKIPDSEPKRDETKEKELNSYPDSKYDRRKDEDYNRGSSNRGGKSSNSYQSDRRQQDGGGRRQDNGRQQNNASSGGYKQREHTYEPAANRDSSKRGEAAKGGQQRSGQSDREERKKTPARETGGNNNGGSSREGSGRGKGGGGDEKQGGNNQRSGENTKTPATRNKSDVEKSKRSGKGGRQNEEESSYDTKPVKSNLQNGHHNLEFSKEQGKGRQNGYDNNDDRYRRDRDYYDNNRRGGGGGDRQSTRGGSSMNGRGGSSGQSSRGGSDRGSRRGGFAEQSGRGSGHSSRGGGGAPSGQSTRGGRGGRQQNGRETRQTRQKSDLGELESGMSRINLANSMSNPSAFPPLPGAGDNSPPPDNSVSDFAAARNESKTKHASPADSVNNKQTDQITNMGGGDAGAGPRLSAPPKTQVYGAPPGAATLGFAGHSAQGHIPTVPPTSVPPTLANTVPPALAATPPGVPPNLVSQVNSVYGPPPGVVQPGFGGPNLGGDIRPPPGGAGGRYPPGAPQQDNRSRYLPPNVYTRGAFHNGAPAPHLTHHIPDHEQEGHGASFSHNPTSQPNSMDMNAYTAPRGPGFQSQQPPQNMNEGFGALPAHQGGFNSGNNGGYFESGDNSNNYNNRQKDNYRGGNRRQPPGGVTNFRGGAGSEPPIHHQAFTTPPPNFTRASSSGGGFGSNSITNGGFSAGPGQNSNHQNHQLNLKEGDKVMAKYWEDGRFYPVEVTAVGDSTAVVLFTEYGNHEEVVWDDIRPISNNYNQGGAFNRGHPPPPHYRR